MTNKYKTLYQLLTLLFPSNMQLRNFLLQYDYGNRHELVATLPDVTVAPLEYISRAVEAIQAHGLDDSAFFVALGNAFRSHLDLIEAKRENYLKGLPITGDPLSKEEPGFDALNPAEAADYTERLEKIMGERPTFLDVSFLEKGLTRARSVVKLRMLLDQTWYAGTGFLLGPDTVLTAHHNLWPGTGPASKVIVVFDYERDSSGALREGETVEADPQTFFGEAADDWAVLRLSAARTDRKPIPLATAGPLEGDRVSIIQHPDGNPKQIALHHNLVTHVTSERVQYLTDTLPGSSGSPVFNEDWEMVAIHHKGGYLKDPGRKRIVYRNQGVNVARVRERLAAAKIWH